MTATTPALASTDSKLSDLLALVARSGSGDPVAPDAIREAILAVERRLLESTKLASKTRRLISEARDLNNLVGELVEHESETEREEDKAIRDELEEWLDETQAYVDANYPRTKD